MRPRTTPTINAAQTTPQNDPRPPITTTTNAAVRISAPIAGCTPEIGASNTPANAASPTLKATMLAMYGVQRNAERGNHVGVLNARPYDATERSSLQQEPQAGDGGDSHRQHQQPVLRVDEVANEQLTFERARNRERHGCRAEHPAQRLFGHHRETEGQQQTECGIRVIEAAKQQALDHQPDQCHQQSARRSPSRRSPAPIVGDDDGEVRAEGIERAMRQIDETAEREDQREPERDQQVIRAGQQAVEDLLEDLYQARAIAARRPFPRAGEEYS